MKKINCIWWAVILSFAILVAWLLPMFSNGGVTVPVSAASVDYPVQLMNIASKDNAKVLTEEGSADGAAVSVQPLGSDLSSSWRFDRVGSNTTGTFFKLVNAQSGRLLTPLHYTVSEGTSVIMYGSESAQCQHWYVIPVKTDHLGNDLYYKIVKAIPHKDCASDAPSDFLSDETKSAVNTLCIHEHFCEI